ncbi:MAG: hypothetical protein SA339_09610 [Methanomassiliicoccus sp.]|nr:hypothetical protein [Methanomassiliicoccus sp.]
MKEGIARRMHEGEGWGQKARTDVNTSLAIELLKVRGSLSAVAKELGVPRNTLREHFERDGVDYKTHLPCRNTPSSKSRSNLNVQIGMRPDGAEVSADIPNEVSGDSA